MQSIHAYIVQDYLTISRVPAFSYVGFSFFIIIYKYLFL